jgi:hypothetical protein
MKRPRIFISHCEKSFGPTDYAIRIIDLIGCVPVIAETQPKLSRTVPSLVSGTLDSCDGAVVIATPDVKGESGWGPSQGVVLEIRDLQKTDKFEGKYFIIKEESVSFSPMIPEARYKFPMNDYAPLSEAILLETGGMGFFRNYYELPGSDLNLHELMETLDSIKGLLKKGLLKDEQINHMVKKLTKDLIEKLKQGDS